MIRKELIKNIIVDNQYRSFPDSWERDLVVPFNTNKIVTISGVRRSGKTYHLFSIIKQLLSKGIMAENILYFNFEDERLDLTVLELQDILICYQELYPDLDLSKCYFFFDEIQEVRGWEKFVARLYSSISQHIFITGSNAKLLSREIATALRGRALNYEVYPLSFREYIGVVAPSLKLNKSTDKAKYLRHFKHFLHYGGFPELINQKTHLHRQILQGYFDVMLVRDLIERYDIGQGPMLRYFCKRIVGASAGELSINKIYLELKSQGYKISKDTLYSYQEYVEAIYLSRLISKYDHSVVKSELATKKTYVIDNGLGSIIDYKLSQDHGRLLENLVALELIKLAHQVNYQKNGSECDFIILENGMPHIAIQVAESVSDQETMDRELAGLINTCKKHQLETGYILTLDESREQIVDGIKVITLPTWQYLLTNGVVSLRHDFASNFVHGDFTRWEDN